MTAAMWWVALTCAAAWGVYLILLAFLPTRPCRDCGQVPHRPECGWWLAHCYYCLSRIRPDGTCGCREGRV